MVDAFGKAATGVSYSNKYLMICISVCVWWLVIFMFGYKRICISMKSLLKGVLN